MPQLRLFDDAVVRRRDVVDVGVDADRGHVAQAEADPHAAGDAVIREVVVALVERLHVSRAEHEADVLADRRVERQLRPERDVGHVDAVPSLGGYPGAFGLDRQMVGEEVSEPGARAGPGLVDDERAVEVADVEGRVRPRTRLFVARRPKRRPRRSPGEPGLSCASFLLERMERIRLRSCNIGTRASLYWRRTPTGCNGSGA